MARSFNSATPDYFRRDTNTQGSGAVLTSTPLTVSVWFKATAGTSTQTMFFLGDKASDFDFWSLSITATGAVRWSIGGGTGTTDVDTTSSFTNGAWTHACGISASSTDHRVFVDGGGKGTSSSVTSPSTTPDRTSLGVLDGSAQANEFSGELGHVAVYNVALTDDEVAALAAGVDPRTIRPGALVAFAPLNGTNPERDVVISDTDDLPTWKMRGVPARVDEPPKVRRSIIAPPYQRYAMLLNDGVSDEHGDTGDGTVLDIDNTDAVSIFIWFRTTSTASNVQLLTKMLRSGTFRGHQHFCNGGSVQFFLANTNGSNHIYTGTVDSTFNDGEWHLAVLTYDGSQDAINGINHYVDDQLRSDSIFGDNLSATCVDTGSEFAIGARVAGGVAVLQNQLDWSIAGRFNKVLSADELTELWHGGKIMDVPSLHSAAADLEEFWRVQDPSSSVVTGEVNGYDLTFVNIDSSNFSDVDVPL